MKLKDSEKSIFFSAVRFFCGTFISRISGMIREITMAVIWGADPVIGTFWIAYRLAFIARKFVGETFLNMAFIPHFEALRKKDEKEAILFFKIIKRKFIRIVSVGVIFVELMILFYFFAYQKWPTRCGLLVGLLTPSLIFLTLFALNSAFLNCQQGFFRPAVAPAIVNVIWVILLLLCRHLSASIFSLLLSLGLGIGFLCQWLITVPDTRKFLRPFDDLKIPSRDKGAFLKFVRPMILGIIGVAATQINAATDMLWARYADPAGPIFLWYALRIQQIPFALIGMGFFSALLPPLSRASQENNVVGGEKFLKSALEQISLVMCVASLGMLFVGYEGLDLIFRHGKFDQIALMHTNTILRGYVPCVLFGSWVIVTAVPFYAKKHYGVPAIAAILSMILNVVFNALFIMVFKKGVVSIAWATSISSCFQFLFLMHSLNKLWKKPSFSFSIYKSLGSIIGIGLLTALALLIFMKFWTGSFVLSSTIEDLHVSFGKRMSLFFVKGVTVISIFIFFCMLFRIASAKEVMQRVKRK